MYNFYNCYRNCYINYFLFVYNNIIMKNQDGQSHKFACSFMEKFRSHVIYKITCILHICIYNIKIETSSS